MELFNPGQLIARNMDATQVHPDILQVVTEILDIHLNSFESTIAVSGRHYIAFGEEGRMFMAMQMARLQREPVMWVKDGMHTSVDRWILGPCETFVSGPHMIVSFGGIAVVVHRPPPQLMEDVTLPDPVSSNATAPERKPKVTRPPNAFILYRKDYQAKIKQTHPHLLNNDISGILGKAWNNESHEVRERYRKLAKEYKERHHKLYPDYRYTPRKPSEKRRRNRKVTTAPAQTAKPSLG
ncbi:Silenced mating-type M-specific polypeptide Mc [Colletotrichum chlorophyti]|uniref:Silenced mating-type M-specific polypeptide Mc n=1 Tax=Colletotrichum chlorophyti TaxID=708187 RepID=A0A1Q8RP76_9PEZI|nr:Silenced mating-type M-specific polypeptide Mc [Colletotrichum chlorophyti]